MKNKQGDNLIELEAIVTGGKYDGNDLKIILPKIHHGGYARCFGCQIFLNGKEQFNITRIQFDLNLRDPITLYLQMAEFDDRNIRKDLKK